MLALGILILGIITRLVVHVPNFTPAIALALFGGFYLKKRQAIILPVAFMAVSDIFLGYHSTMLFTWGSVGLIAALGFWGRQHKSWTTMAGTSLFSAVLFFVVTNFGTWLAGDHLYPLTLDGLKECYVMAIPFFRSTLLSTLIYSIVFFGAYEGIAVRLKQTRFAHVL